MANSQTATDNATLAGGRRFWLIVPGWLLSVVFHGLLILGLGVWLPARSLWGTWGTKVGIDLELGTYSPGAQGAFDDSTLETESTASNDTVLGAMFTQGALVDLDDVSLVLVSPPDASGGVIGPGPVLLANTGPGTEDLLKSWRTGVAGAIGGIGKGGTSFFGGYVTGTRFVYVVDCSGSMTNHNAMGAAKAELLASLEKLDDTQQFQIIFYNDRPHLMPTPGGKNGLLFATETNRSLARQFVLSTQADRGTAHFEAIKLGLDFKPEVIFFLTDATEPRLDAADLEKVSRQNSGRTQIHTVQFDVGESLNDDNFLRKLARQNDGKFTYRDITQFSRPSE